MAELTTEYLEKTLDKRFDDFSKIIDSKLDNQTKELKQFTEEQVEGLAVMIQRSVVEPMNHRFDQVEYRLDKVETRLSGVENKLTSVDSKFEKLENTLNVKL